MVRVCEWSLSNACMFAGEIICIRAGLTVDEAAKFIVALLTLVNVV